MITEQQRQDRKKGIGGSDVAAILGLSKYKTPIDIYLEKTSDYVKPVDDKSQLRMDIGNLLESYLVDSFSERNNVSVIKSVKTHIDANHDFLMANVDGFLVEHHVSKEELFGWMEYKAILEIKTARQKTSEWGEPGSNLIPMEYLCQVAYYCMVTDLPRAHISVYFKQEEEIVDYIYERDLNLENYILEKLLKFWNNNVLAGIMPDPIQISDIEHVYKNVDKIKLDIEDMSDIEQYKLLRERIKELEEERDTYKNKIIMRLKGYGDILNWDKSKIGSFKTQSSTRLDIDFLKKNYLEAYNASLKETTFPVLRIK